MERRKAELRVEHDSLIRQAFDDSRAERERYLRAAAAAPAGEGAPR
jgi:hypothetical protein